MINLKMTPLAGCFQVFFPRPGLATVFAQSVPDALKNCLSSAQGSKESSSHHSLCELKKVVPSENGLLPVP